MQKCGDDVLFIKAVLGREGERVDPTKVPIGRFANRLLDRSRAVGI